MVNALDTQLNLRLKDTFQYYLTYEDSNDAKMTNKTPGIYVPEERRKKILRFKIKKLIWRMRRPIMKKYVGRSIVAQNKKRFRGKFVKNNYVRKIFSVTKNL